MTHHSARQHDPATPDAAARARQLLERARALDPHDLPAAQAASLEAIGLADPESGVQDLALLLDCLHQHGIICDKIADYPAAFAAFTRELEISRAIGRLETQTRAENSLGVLNGLMGNFSAGLQHFFSVYQACEQERNLPEQAAALNNIGYSLIMLNDFQRALPYLEQGAALARQDQNRLTLATTLDSLCHAWLNLGDYGQALQFSLESVLVSRQIGAVREECEYCLSAGRVYQAFGEPESARESFDMSLALARQHGFRRESSEALRRLAGIYQLNGEIAEAQALLQSATAIAEEIQAMHELYQCHHDLAEIYKQAQDFQAALDHYQQYHRIQQKVYNHEADLRYQSLEIMHQLDQARKETVTYQLKNQALQEEIAEVKLAAAADPLTGLLNRGEFLRQAEHSLLSAARGRTCLAVLMLDLDHFKQVNDNYGHNCGDVVLASVSAQLRHFLRSDDLVGRVGGEEFCIVLPGASLTTARKVAERIRKGIEGYAIHHNGSVVQITCSIGYRVLDPTVSEELFTLAEMIDQADQAMYRAKKAGRNQIAGM